MELIKSIFYILSLVILIGCETEPDSTLTLEAGVVNAGDIVVTNFASDSAILLDKNGKFKRVLLNVPNNQEQVTGVSWNPITQEVILAINGFPDRIVGVSAFDASVRDVVRNTQLNGNVYGVSVTDSGEYLVVESNNIEKFTATGSRISDGDFPATGIMNNPVTIRSLDLGGFVLCATGTDRVRIYNDSANQQNETSSGIGGTTNAYGCGEMSNGNIVATWDGSADSVAIYNSTLGTELFRFRDPSILSSPRSLTVRENGNILVADAGFDWIIELDNEANFLRIFSSGIFNDPYQMIEIPSD